MRSRGWLPDSGAWPTRLRRSSYGRLRLEELPLVKGTPFSGRTVAVLPIVEPVLLFYNRALEKNASYARMLARLQGRTPSNDLMLIAVLGGASLRTPFLSN